MSDFESAQKRRSLQVGLFALVGLGAFVWMVFKFNDLPATVSQFRSYLVLARFSTAPGVQKDTPVRFCGYQIGRVTQVKPPTLLPEVINGKETGRSFHQSVVVMAIDKQYDSIPANSVIKLMTRGLGSSYIEIKAPLPWEEPPPSEDVLVHGIIMQGQHGMTNEFFPEESQKKFEELVAGLSVLVGNANEIIGDPENKRNIGDLLTNINQASRDASATLVQAEKALAEAMDAIKAYRELAQAGKQSLQRVDTRVEDVAVAMVTTSEELGKASAQMRLALEKVNAGDGTLGKLLVDARMYEKMLETVAQAQQLIAEIHLSFRGINELGLKKVWSKGVPVEEEK